MFDLHARRTSIALVIASAAVAAAPAAAQLTPHQIISDPGFGELSGAQQLARIAEQTGGGHLAIINSKAYVRYPDGRLVSVSAARAAAQRTPHEIISDPGFGELSGAQQLARIAEQTGGGHLAIINSKAYVRYPDGRLVSVSAATKPRSVRRTPRQLVREPGFGRLTGAQQLARIAEQTGGGHLAIINSKAYVRYPDGTLVGM